jgi:hypothetical protein
LVDKKFTWKDVIIIHDPYEINTKITTKKKLEEKAKKTKKIKKKDKPSKGTQKQFN